MPDCLEHPSSRMRSLADATAADQSCHLLHRRCRAQVMQLSAPPLSPTAPSSTVPNTPPAYSSLLLVTSLVLLNPIVDLGRTTDDGDGCDAYGVASSVLEGGAYLLVTKPDDGEQVIKKSSLSSRVACVDSSTTLDQPHCVAAFTTSGGAHTIVPTTSGDRVQVRRSTCCICPTAVRIPAAECPSSLMPCS